MTEVDMLNIRVHFSWDDSLMYGFGQGCIMTSYFRNRYAVPEVKRSKGSEVKGQANFTMFSLVAFQPLCFFYPKSLRDFFHYFTNRKRRSCIMPRTLGKTG